MAIAGTNAAVGIGKVIGDYHDQQANLAIQTGATQYQAGVSEAITNGYDPYKIETGEDGSQTRRYIGFDGYKTADGRTLGDLKQEIINTVGKNYWTNSGSERGKQIAANAFENIELDAQRQMANEVIKNRQAVFDQELANAIEVYRKTGDDTQLNAVINGATMSDDQRKATRLDAERKANILNINDTAMSKAQSQGMDSVKTYLAEQVRDGKINKVQECEMLETARKARATAVKPEQDKLDGEWDTKTANATPESAAGLKTILQSQQRKFEACDNQESYYKFMRRLDSMSGGTGNSGRSEAEIDKTNAAYMEAVWKKYENGQIGIDEAYEEMDNLESTKWTNSEKEKYYKKMLEYKDPLTARAYERFDRLCKDYKVDERTKSDMREILTRMFTNNEVRSADREAYVNSVIDKQIAEQMNKAVRPNARWSEAELKKQNELSYSGRLDPYFAPVGKDGQHEMEVTGAGEIKKNVINYSRGEVEKAIEATDMKYIDHEEVKRSENDKTGRIVHTLEKENGERVKVIVNKEGRLEKIDENNEPVLDEDGKPVLFDKELETEQAAAFKKIEDSLPEGTQEKIAAELRKTRSQNTSYKRSYEDEYKKALGKKVLSPVEKAYCAMMQGKWRSL